MTQVLCKDHHQVKNERGSGKHTIKLESGKTLKHFLVKIV